MTPDLAMLFQAGQRKQSHSRPHEGRRRKCRMFTLPGTRISVGISMGRTSPASLGTEQAHHPQGEEAPRGRIRSRTPRRSAGVTAVQVIWVCNNCRKQQELLTKPGEWFSGPGGKLLASDVGDKKLRSRSQAPASSAQPPDDPNRLCAPGTMAGIDARSRSEPPRDMRNGRGGGGAGRGEHRPGQPRLKAQVSMDRHLRGDSRERREGRRLTKGRSLEHDPVGTGGGGNTRRLEEGGYHHTDHPAASNPALPRQHLGQQQQQQHQQQQQQQLHHTGVPGAPGGRGHQPPIKGGTVSVGFEAMARVGAAGPLGPMAPKQRTAGGAGVGVGVGGLHEHAPLSQPCSGPPELREPSGLGPGSGSAAAEEGPPPARRSKREKAESMLRNDSLSSDQSESLRPPPPRPYKSKRGMGGAGGKRQTSISSSEEEGGTTPEYSSCEDAEIESVSERGGNR
ncbi:unnamed protein product [Merluccius merluccius]